ncbi:HI0933 family protein [Syntrophobotulus glycolicus DSM 8271]|uniref:HI0933 family protein n=1 Tax=Syntrophobotulus glycolicus (strain DSM 8271 / FlGlyR) TaxID=645991 RepID=F0SYU5_SYNGF|nr:NAD(P)/FAD-dependent oxidoreductase [Syntrophobotulus glycolicus]ADY55982.1 HI0933 family protein [Syntrophobotulus glycolicus DSM 8271]
MTKELIVIGGGAAGIMAAGRAASEGTEVILCEKMSRLGSKIAISGKGRCNITNAGDIRSFIENFPGNGKFLFASFKEFDNEALRNFFAEFGVETKVERGGRVFPVSDQAEAVVHALGKYAEQSGVKVRLRTKVAKILIENNTVVGVEVEESSGGKKKIPAGAVIVSTGGASFPGTGSTGDGYKIAAEAGHHLIEPLPSLVPMRVLEDWPKELQGLALKNVAVSLWAGDKKKAEEFGEMLFTHFGVSGPIILTLSRFAVKELQAGKRISLRLNMKPALREEQLDLRLQRDFAKFSNKQLKNALNDLLPKSMIPVLIRLSQIDQDKQVHHISRSERMRLVKLLQDLRMTVTGTLGMGAAIVTSGGVDVKEINPATMESKLVKGLFWAGEVIDIDGITGGYNLQAAFSTGFKAGKSAAQYLKTKV